VVAEGLVQTGNLFLQPLYQLWLDFVSVFPSIVVALLLLIVGYFVAYGIGHFFRWLLEKAGVNKYMREAMFSKEFGHTNLPSLVGEVVKWFVFIIFLQVAVSVLNLTVLSEVLSSFVDWLPNLIVAIIIFVVGVALAHYVDRQVRMHTQRYACNVWSFEDSNFIFSFGNWLEASRSRGRSFRKFIPDTFRRSRTWLCFGFRNRLGLRLER